MSTKNIHFLAFPLSKLQYTLGFVSQIEIMKKRETKFIIT